MPKYSSHLLLSELRQHTGQILQLAISEWQMTPNELFAKQSSPGSWSANECLQHLNSYGVYYYPAIRKAITSSGKTRPNEIFTAGFLGHLFTKMMIPGNEQKPAKKMKAPKDHRPAQILPSHEVISTFISQQEELLQLLEKARQVNLNRVRVPISLAKFIRMKLGDTFHFLVMHNLRHVLQAERALGHATRLPGIVSTQKAIV